MNLKKPLIAMVGSTKYPLDGAVWISCRLSIRRASIGNGGVQFLGINDTSLISSPLLLIFSPLLFGAGAVLVAALAGIGMAMAAGLSGLFTFGWISKELGVGRLLQFGLYGGRDRWID